MPTIAPCVMSISESTMHEEMCSRTRSYFVCKNSTPTVLKMEVEKTVILPRKCSVPVAKWIRHLTSNQGIAGSSPARDNLFLLSKWKIRPPGSSPGWDIFVRQAAGEYSLPRHSLMFLDFSCSIYYPEQYPRLWELRVFDEVKTPRRIVY